MGSALTCPETGERMLFKFKTDAKSVARAWKLHSRELPTLRRQARSPV